MNTLQDDIIRIFRKSQPFAQLISAFGNPDNKYVKVIGAVGGACSFIAASFYRELSSDVLCVLPTEEEALSVYQDLLEIFGEQRVSFFPAHGKRALSEVGPLSTVVGKKLSTIKKLLLSETPGIVVTPAKGILEKVATRKALLSEKITLSPQAKVPFLSLIKKLINIGYTREERVDRPGEMSVRGGIIDIFLYEENNPYRIEYFADEIESIREFDVESQRSIRKVNRVDILPVSAVGPYGPFDEHPINSLKCDGTLLDYFNENSVVFMWGRSIVLNEMEDYEADISQQLRIFSHEQALDVNIEYNSYYEKTPRIEKILKTMHCIDYSFYSVHEEKAIDFQMRANSYLGGNLKLLKNEFREINSKYTNPTVHIFCDSASQQTHLQTLARQEHFPPNIVISEMNLSRGFLWPHYHLFVYTNREIYGKARHYKLNKIDSRRVSFQDVASLKIGDLVVHTDYGIGIFRGLKPITAYGREQECLEIEYRDGDKLYVPIDKMDRVQKYSSREGVAPVLSKLGSPAWEKLKTRTKKRVKDIAEKLIKLYAKRKMQRGYAFSKDTIWQSELEASFVYDETLDQLQAIQDIKKDMERPVPMDRLVCGDVGFGKTEVAIRVAFKAVNDGKQVAVLVPTTVLAQQHYITFQDRLKNFPVTIETLSRFKSGKQQKEIIEKIERGDIDIVIGTHRLLSNDVKFKDLGLLIVDEEHKFGVLHKEKLKILKETVDTLTLSATPIPRTMHMALIGSRDISIINTPPSNRLPIKTEVCRFDNNLIREIILKEIERGGQVFFVHNRVQSIYAIANQLRQLVPEVSFAVAHGQMKPRDLEKVMMEFTEGRIQCLVSSMIIESGIDMPRANTLIINRADRFGLAQLYQLRGRVGRSGHQAYAYLLVPPIKKLNRNAVKRLQTIQEFTHLGSGYKVALKDLEIRGAGNIFGAEQSGFIDSLGFELYQKIIQEAVRELRTELGIEKPEQGQREKIEKQSLEPRIHINVDAYLPPQYINSAAERVDIYKRLIEAQDKDEIFAIQKELLDRFGVLPKPAQNLIDYILIKMLAQKAAMEEIKIDGGKFIGKFHTQSVMAKGDFRSWLQRLVQKSERPFEFKQQNDTLILEFRFEKGQEFLTGTKNFLHAIV